MTSRDFAYWLNGFFELSGDKELNNVQVACIKRHLAMVFVHEIDPSMPNPELDKIHNDPIVPSGEPWQTGNAVKPVQTVPGRMLPVPPEPFHSVSPPLFRC